MIKIPNPKNTVLNPSYSLHTDPLGKMPKDFYARITNALPEWASILSKYYRLPKRHAYVIAIGGVCKLNGARINEILTLTWNQVLPSGMAFIKGSKGSNSRLIFIGLSAVDVIKARPEDGKTLVFTSCYREVYRTLKNYGLDESIEGHKNMAVTHSGRYAIARAVAHSLGMSEASQVLGHKSKTAIDHYTGNIDLKKERERKQRQRNRQKLMTNNVNLPEFLFEDWGV